MSKDVRRRCTVGCRLNRLSYGCGFWQGFRFAFQGALKHLVDPANRYDFDLVFDVVRDLRQILDVFFRDQRNLQTATDGCQSFLLEPPNRQNLAAQGNLASHADIAANRNAGIGRN